MADARTPAAKLALWALGYLAISWSLGFPLSDFLTSEQYFTGAFDFILMPAVAMPLLSAWLAARHGRRAFIPLLIAAPFIGGRLTPDTMELSRGFGAGLALLAASAVAILIFSRPARRRSPSIAGVTIDVALLAIASLSFLVTSNGVDGLSYTLALEGHEGIAIAAFALAAAGRSPLIIAPMVVAMTAGLWAANTFTADGLTWAVEAGDWRASIGWTANPGTFLACGLAAALAGGALHGLRADVGKFRNLATAGVAIFVLVGLPGIFAMAGEAAANAIAPQSEVASTSDARLILFQEALPAEPETEIDNLVVTAERRESTTDAVTALVLALLGAAAFVLGAAGGRRVVFWTPLIVALMRIAGRAVTAAPGFEILPDAGPFYNFVVGLFSGGLDGITALGTVAWVFAWFGARWTELRQRQAGAS